MTEPAQTRSYRVFRLVAVIPAMKHDEQETGY